MKNYRLTLEHVLYVLALLVALGYRLIALGAWPLTESEASLAFGAYQLAHGIPAQIGSFPLAQLGAGWLFRLFTSNEFLARLIPALAGSLLVLLPYAWRDRIGRMPAVVLALGLAIEPSLVAAARTADGPMLAIALLLAAMTAWANCRFSLAGIALALALLSGPAVWHGLLIVLIAALLLRAFGSDSPSIESSDLRAAAPAFGLTLLFAGAWFLRSPQGIAGVGGGLFDFLSGWRMAAGVSVLELLGSWLVYLPFSLVFGLVALVLLYRRQDSSFLVYASFTLAAVLVVVFYPGRVALDLVWVSLPMLLLSAVGLAVVLDWAPEDGPVAWAQAGLVFCFLCFAWLDLASLNGVFDPTQVRLRLIIAAGVFLITFLATLLIGIGWEFRGALFGLAWGYGLFLLFYIAGVAWTSTHLAERRIYETWHGQPAMGAQAELLDQLTHFGETNLGYAKGIDVVFTVDSAALRWTLRDFPQARYEMQLGAGELPTAVITDAQAEGVFLQTAYRGESFPWKIHTATFDDDAFPWISWFFRRTAPVSSEPLVLWVRGDAFPSGSLIQSDGSTDVPSQPEESEDDVVPEVGQ